MKAVLAALAVVVIAIAIYLLTRGGGTDTARAPRSPNGSAETSPAPTGSAAAAPDAGSKARSIPRAHTEAERAAMLEKIATARSQRTTAEPSTSSGTTPAPALPPATTLDIKDRTGDTSDWEKRTLGTLNSLLGECYDLGRAEDPKLEGTLGVRFTLAGEPGVGGLLERVDIVPEMTTLSQPVLLDCVTQQLYALELDPPPSGTRVERELSLKFP